MNAHDQRVENLFKWAMFALGAVFFMKTGEALVLDKFYTGVGYGAFGGFCFSMVTYFECRRCKNGH